MIYPQIPTSITTLRAKVDIYNDGTLAATCSCSDFLQDFTIHKEGDTSKFFGFGVTHKLDINFIDIEKQLKTKIKKGSKLVIKMGDGTTFYDVYPPMYVAEVTRNEKTNNISCVAYDVLYKAKTLTVTDVFNYIKEHNVYPEYYSDPLTLRELVEACGRLLTNRETRGQLNTSLAIQNGTYKLTNTLNLNGDEPLKVLLDAIAEFTQTIYFIDNLGRLTYKTINKSAEPVLTVTKDMYFDLVTSDSKAITGICLTNELGNSITVGDETGEVQIIRNNPIYEVEANVTSYLENALLVVRGSNTQTPSSNIDPIVYHQLECEWDGNCNLEIGDKVAFVTEDDSIVTTYLINDVIEYRGFLNEITSWEYTKDDEETADNPTTLGDKLKQTTAIVDKVNQEINLVVQDVAGAKSELSSLRLTTDSISLRVEKFENQDSDLENRVGILEVTDSEINATVSSVTQEIKQRIDDAKSEIETLTKEVNLKVNSDALSIVVQKTLEQTGIDKVTTTAKHYTFDDNGLDISDPGSEISTLITEDGMRIYKNNTEVLTADNQGVKATDLHARTYLIIGENSRLEDKGDRTACFWIGPAGG